MGVKKGHNNFKTYQQDRVVNTVVSIKAALDRYKVIKHPFRNKTDLAKILSGEVDMSYKHILKYYSAYLEEYLVSLSGENVKLIPDDKASNEVLIAKLRLERIERAKAESELAKCKRIIEGKVTLTEKTKYEIAFDSTAKILYEIIARLSGSIECDKTKMSIIDSTPPFGCSDIIAEKELSKYYFEWLKSHPMYGDQNG